MYEPKKSPIALISLVRTCLISCCSPHESLLPPEPVRHVWLRQTSLCHCSFRVAAWTKRKAIFPIKYHYCLCFVLWSVSIRQHPSVKSHLCRLKTLLRLCRDCSELTAMQEIGYHKQVQCYLLLRIFFYSLILCLILEDVFRYSYADFRF